MLRAVVAQENHTYLADSHIGVMGLRALCPLLDQGLVADLSEGTYTRDWRTHPYTWDCRRYGWR
eukprot:3294540-Amphidinium_carterae.1